MKKYVYILPDIHKLLGDMINATKVMILHLICNDCLFQALPFAQSWNGTQCQLTWVLFTCLFVLD